MDDLDRILASEEPLIPSSGFVSAVMDALHDATVAPAPLPFPWGRFLGGLAACVVSAGVGALILRDIETAVAAALLPSVELGYAALAIAGSVLPVYIRRIARR